MSVACVTTEAHEEDTHGPGDHFVNVCGRGRVRPDPAPRGRVGPAPCRPQPCSQLMTSGIDAGEKRLILPGHYEFGHAPVSMWTTQNGLAFSLVGCLWGRGGYGKTRR